MASEDSISSSHKSATDGPEDSRAPIQRLCTSHTGKASAAQKAERGRSGRKIVVSKAGQPHAGQMRHFQKRLHHANAAKLYSELSTSHLNASVEFPIDSMLTGLRDNRQVGAPG